MGLNEGERLGRGRGGRGGEIMTHLWRKRTFPCTSCCSTTTCYSCCSSSDSFLSFSSSSFSFSSSFPFSSFSSSCLSNCLKIGRFIHGFIQLVMTMCIYHLQGTQSKRPVEAQNAILRRHFLEMTQSFMIPLVREDKSFGCLLAPCAM